MGSNDNTKIEPNGNATTGSNSSETTPNLAFIPPPFQHAIVAEAGDRIIIRDDVPLPVLDIHEFLVRTDAWAINPSDTKMRGDFVTPGAMLGCDYAGTVVARGPGVTDSVIKIGDRVCGAQYEMNAKRPYRAAFGEFNIPTGPFWLKLPDEVSTEGGATLSAGLGTAGLALRLLGFELPFDFELDLDSDLGLGQDQSQGQGPDGQTLDTDRDGHGHTPTSVQKKQIQKQKPAYVLVYGGGTATATIAIQLLKLIDMIPITACSPVHAERLKSYGAETTFDYHEPDCANQIKTYTKNNLRYALDCITTIESTTFCFKALGRAGGKYVSLDPFTASAATRATVKTDWVLGPSLFGEGCVWPDPYARPPSPELLVYGTRLWAWAQRLLDGGRLAHHPVRVLEAEAEAGGGGGLDKVLVGMEMVAKRELRGEKCVVKLKRT
ncbi:hypothetical protein A1O3_00845 [Capronia epimyces CBS 606.96]|uniref:Alcohol dehydrogenase-like N-terminal domain-containing protein n=1 Tax=Capronia epimyces CBS 606.96 TaxID=1182542 RepID=W9YRI2_9EURO|nr:uncharacterized protein A1O3_00845 [Capronia epimyces CBS 606.96]EXJ92295.1 hypothetical protein A1O3_00845 [Capronia epimyces CBS 606.96]